MNTKIHVGGYYITYVLSYYKIHVGGYYIIILQ